MGSGCEEEEERAVVLFFPLCTLHVCLSRPSLCLTSQRLRVAQTSRLLKQPVQVELSHTSRGLFSTWDTAGRQADPERGWIYGTDSAYFTFYIPFSSRLWYPFAWGDLQSFIALSKRDKAVTVSRIQVGFYPVLSDHTGIVGITVTPIQPSCFSVESQMKYFYCDVMNKKSNHLFFSQELVTWFYRASTDHLHLHGSGLSPPVFVHGPAEHWGGPDLWFLGVQTHQLQLSQSAYPGLVKLSIRIPGLAELIGSRKLSVRRPVVRVSLRFWHRAALHILIRVHYWGVSAR